MLRKYNTQEYLRAEAMATTLYIYNRVLDKVSSKRTAYEEIFEKKANFKHVKIFGCKCYGQVPKEEFGNRRASNIYLSGTTKILTGTVCLMERQEASS